MQHDYDRLTTDEKKTVHKKAMQEAKKSGLFTGMLISPLYSAAMTGTPFNPLAAGTGFALAGAMGGGIQYENTRERHINSIKRENRNRELARSRVRHHIEGDIERRISPANMSFERFRAHEIQQGRTTPRSGWQIREKIQSVANAATQKALSHQNTHADSRNGNVEAQSHTDRQRIRRQRRRDIPLIQTV